MVLPRSDRRQGNHTNSSDQIVSTSTTTTATTGLPRQLQRKREDSNRQIKVKRAPRPRRMPQYAIASCQDEAAYESACACVGVYRTTVYAGSATFTQTIVESTYSPTLTDTTTAETESSTQTVSTETVTSTVSTETAVATSIFQGPFWIQVVSATTQSQPNLVGSFASTSGFNPQSSFNNFMFNGDPEAAAFERGQFLVDNEGYLRPLGISRGPGVDLYVSYIPMPFMMADRPFNLGTTREAALNAGERLLSVTIVDNGAYNEILLVSPDPDLFRSCQLQAGVAFVLTGDTASCVTIRLAALPVGLD